MANQLADLTNPKVALQVLHDDIRLNAWDSAIRATIGGDKGGRLLHKSCSGGVPLTAVGDD